MNLNELFEFMDREPVSKSPAADKIAQVAASYGKDDMDYDDLVKAAELLRAGKLKTLGKFVYDLDTDPRELIMSVINDVEPDTFKKMYGDQTGYMSLMNPQGMDEDDPTSTKLDSEEIKQKALLYMMRQHTYRKDRRQYDADNSGNADKFYTEQDIENLEAMIAHLKDGASLDPALQDKLAKVLRDAKVKDRTGRFAMRKMDLAKQYQDQLRKYKPLEMGEDINDIVRLSGIK